MSSILLPILYPSKNYAFQADPRLSDILKEVVDLQNTSGVMMDVKISKVAITQNLTTEAYIGSSSFDRNRDIFSSQIDQTWALPNRTVLKKIDENIRTEFSPFAGEGNTLSSHVAMAFQLANPAIIPDVKYNVYIMNFDQNIENYGGLFENSDTYKLDILTNNILALNGSTPQTFHSKIDPSKVKISKIGFPVGADEYDINDIMKDIFIRENKDSTKLGNLKKLTFVEGQEFKQIASNVSVNDTLIIMNHNMTLKFYNYNHLHFDSLFYVPVGTTINEYLAEEKLKKELIRMKLIELITGKIN